MADRPVDPVGMFGDAPPILNGILIVLLEKYITWCYIKIMKEESKQQKKRVFKSSWFTKAAKKARISDQVLLEAIIQVMKGQAVDLGGGVFKKRLNENKHRSIILAKGSHYWVYQFLFAKKDLDNISDDELNDFRKLAKSYEDLNEKEIEKLLLMKALVEINYENNKD